MQESLFKGLVIFCKIGPRSLSKRAFFFSLDKTAVSSVIRFRTTASYAMRTSLGRQTHRERLPRGRDFNSVVPNCQHTCLVLVVGHLHRRESSKRTDILTVDRGRGTQPRHVPPPHCSCPCASSNVVYDAETAVRKFSTA
jgi:hypothetical protein